MSYFCGCFANIKPFEGVYAKKDMGSGNKSYLPQKTCPVCGFAFTWRKKWEKNWEHVIYCSEKCRRVKKITPTL
jgi:hypothetical protein